MDEQHMTAKKLLTVFSIRPPDFLADADDECYYPLLGTAIQRELRNRMKLQQYNSLDDAVELLRNAKNIVVSNFLLSPPPKPDTFCPQPCLLSLLVSTSCLWHPNKKLTPRFARS